MNDEPIRVFRGGCWLTRPSVARVADRNGSAPGRRRLDLGVRLVRLLTPLQQVAEVNND